jgi:hypothetical protein
VLSWTSPVKFAILVFLCAETQVQNAIFDHLDVTFNEAIDPTTFSTQDVTITGPQAT